MTPVALVQHVWTTRRGVGLVIAALVLGIAMLLYSLAGNQPRVVQYGSAIIAPEKASYCPGETLRYQVHVEVDAHSLPSVSRIYEGWYSVARGVVLRDTVTELTIPLLRPTDIDATASRVVPDVEPGEYWYDHVSRNGRIEAYTVGPIEVLDDFFCGK
mgnify:CR=1 FL=1